MALNFTIKPFDELTAVDVYHILKARVAVFLLEQGLAYQDIDNTDFDCLHAVAHRGGELIGYARITPPVTDDKGRTDKTSPVVIDRLLILPEHRGYGIGHELMGYILKYCKKTHRKHRVKAVVPTQATGFFEPLGFESSPESVQKHGIEHRVMQFDPKKKNNRLKLASSTRSKSVFINLIYLVMTVIMLACIAGVLYLMS